MNQGAQRNWGGVPALSVGGVVPPSPPLPVAGGVLPPGVEDEEPPPQAASARQVAASTRPSRREGRSCFMVVWVWCCFFAGMQDANSPARRGHGAARFEVVVLLRELGGQCASVDSGWPDLKRVAISSAVRARFQMAKSSKSIAPRGEAALRW